MGRIKGKHVKTLAKALVKQAPGEYTEDYDANKGKLRVKETKDGKRLLAYSKKDFNRLVGQVTNLTKMRLHPKEPSAKPRPREGRDGERGDRDRDRGERGGWGRSRDYR